MFESMKVTLATPAQTPGRFANKVTILCPQFEVGANTDVWDEALGQDPKRYSKLESRSKLGSEGKTAEAGKVWEKGRNWTVVVVEVVCATVSGERDEVKEDEDVLEIPVFVRIEYDAVAEEHGELGDKDGKKEKREMAYWTVLGVGKVGKS